MATIQRIGDSPEDETTSGNAAWVASQSDAAFHAVSVSGRNATFKRMPVTRRQDGTMLFDPKAMTPLTPYKFNFLGHDMAVIKSPKGDMEFFYSPNSADDADETPE